MKRFIEEVSRTQVSLLPECLDDFVAEGVVEVFVEQLDLFSQSLVAIDGSKFKAVNNRDRNFTHGKLRARMEQIEKSIDRYLAAMDTADRIQSDVAEAKAIRLQDKIEKLRQQMQALKEMEQQLREAPNG